MKQERAQLSQLLPWVVFALMALCLLGVLMTGAGVTQRLSRSGSRSSRSRTAALYLTTRVQQAEAVEIGTFGEGQALIFPEKIGEETYFTRVYCHDGRLWELFSRWDLSLSPEDGEALLELDRLDMTLEHGILRLDTGDCQLVFAIASRREAIP